MKQPIADPQQGNRPSEELDGLLRTFFRAEMPEPWPAFAPPVFVRPAPSIRPLRRSRMVLAASVALLLIGQLCMSGMRSDHQAMTPELFPSKFEATNRDRVSQPRLLKPQPKAEAPKKQRLP